MGCWGVLCAAASQGSSGKLDGHIDMPFALQEGVCEDL